MVYHQLISLKPENLDEFTLINKLSQSLNCHGYVAQASKLACVLGQKIITTYPERVASGELNFSEITEKAKVLCETFVNCPENERITFELAILGLTVPRLPASTNLEEVSYSILFQATLNLCSSECLKIYLWCQSTIIRECRSFDNWNGSHPYIDSIPR